MIKKERKRGYPEESQKGKRISGKSEAVLIGFAMSEKWGTNL